MSALRAALREIERDFCRCAPMQGYVCGIHGAIRCALSAEPESPTATTPAGERDGEEHA